MPEEETEEEETINTEETEEIAEETQTETMKIGGRTEGAPDIKFGKESSESL